MSQPHAFVVIFTVMLICVRVALNASGNALNAFGECTPMQLSDASVAQSCTLPLLPFFPTILCIRKKATSSIVMKRGCTCSIARITCRQTKPCHSACCAQRGFMMHSPGSVLPKTHLHRVYGVQTVVWSEGLPHEPVPGIGRYGINLKGGAPTASSRGKRFWLALSKSVCWLRGERS